MLLIIINIYIEKMSQKEEKAKGDAIMMRIIESNSFSSYFAEFNSEAFEQTLKNKLEPETTKKI